METNKCWTIYGDKWIIADSDFPFDQIIPAPSMSELWEWLPEAINGTDCFYVLQMKKARTHTKVGYIWEPGEEIMATIDDPNPTDALGELALWMVENKKKERK